ncbi:hypothetical protein PR048_033020 [Dryococelus australis]|uniref:HMG box domain-containing protein n=1 Tax=Dryococelus australis TaxID=614101 RepID=A0ABQ9G3U8_9NEOP|nr:hypothetical protein PR048_033020 [Dryococelus australis]
MECGDEMAWLKNPWSPCHIDCQIKSIQYIQLDSPKEKKTDYTTGSPVNICISQMEITKQFIDPIIASPFPSGHGEIAVNHRHQVATYATQAFRRAPQFLAYSGMICHSGHIGTALVYHFVTSEPPSSALITKGLVTFLAIEHETRAHPRGSVSTGCKSHDVKFSLLTASLTGSTTPSSDIPFGSRSAFLSAFSSDVPLCPRSAFLPEFSSDVPFCFRSAFLPAFSSDVPFCPRSAFLSAFSSDVQFCSCSAFLPEFSTDVPFSSRSAFLPEFSSDVPFCPCSAFLPAISSDVPFCTRSAFLPAFSSDVPFCTRSAFLPAFSSYDGMKTEVDRDVAEIAAKTPEWESMYYTDEEMNKAKYEDYKHLMMARKRKLQGHGLEPSTLAQ